MTRIGHECPFCGGTMEPVSDEDAVRAAVLRMRHWAGRHGEADTQGLMEDEWEALARAAFGEWDA